LNEGTVEYAEGLPPGYDPDQRIYSFRGVRDIASVYGRIQHPVADNVILHAEAQLVHQRYGLRDEWQRGQRVSYATTDGGVSGNGGDVFDVNYLFFNPRIGALWTIDEHQRAFVFVASTSREPRRANLYDAAAYWYSGQGPAFAADTTGGTTRYDFSSPLTKPERLLDIEAQYTYDDGRVRVSATPYALLFTDELVKNGAIDVFGLPVEGNVSSSSHVGVELEASYATETHPWGQLRLWANGTVSRNRIGDDPIAGFPDLLGNVGVQYGFQDLTVDLVVKHVGAFVTQTGASQVAYNTMVDPYTILNASAAYRLRDLGPFPSVRLMVTGTNLLDHLYAAGGIGKEFFPAARRNAVITLECTL
jgi:iron complex outermembrane receptor protein